MLFSVGVLVGVAIGIPAGVFWCAMRPSLVKKAQHVIDENLEKEIDKILKRLRNQ